MLLFVAQHKASRRQTCRQRSAACLARIRRQEAIADASPGNKKQPCCYVASSSRAVRRLWQRGLAKKPTNSLFAITPQSRRQTILAFPAEFRFCVVVGNDSSLCGLQATAVMPLAWRAKRPKEENQHCLFSLMTSRSSVCQTREQGTIILFLHRERWQ